MVGYLAGETPAAVGSIERGECSCAMHVGRDTDRATLANPMRLGALSVSPLQTHSFVLLQR